MIRQIVTYPNNRLTRKSKLVQSFDVNLHNLLDDMYDTMLEYKGIGLAAIQVDEALSCFILCVPDENDEQDKESLVEVVNPTILHKSGEIMYEEGCLSVPTFTADIKRYKDIKVKYYDRNNNEIIKDLSELDAIAFQHELDHLKGKLFVDYLNILKRKKFEKEYKQLLKEKKKSK